ncbi:hypothetical protein BegalDRAFT_0617 [Beggiatoa alba B18LD]|uniref:Uncharacterized protein n=1 Tax=Beggiatoa alba B18LD TaxID=395493 RepID=I3CD38_9GAMM|nr:hypothetical protein [Beggiatoa alba]EIJ41531.1 hypothetical protein BegalDRAFT_0617 [Beggiatoa alba B18LD]
MKLSISSIFFIHTLLLLCSYAYELADNKYLTRLSLEELLEVQIVHITGKYETVLSKEMLGNIFASPIENIQPLSTQNLFPPKQYNLQGGVCR